MKKLEYRLLIERLERERTGETVLNSSFSHASIINECMFSKAHTAVTVLTRRLAPTVFGTDGFVNAFKDSGERGVKVKILVESLSSKDLMIHPLASTIQDYPSISIRRVALGLVDDFDVNYTVMDDDSYRFERDKHKAVAVAAFGDRQGFSRRLKSHFDYYWSVSEPVIIQ